MYTYTYMYIPRSRAKKAKPQDSSIAIDIAPPCTYKYIIPYYSTLQHVPYITAHHTKPLDSMAIDIAPLIHLPLMRCTFGDAVLHITISPWTRG